MAISDITRGAISGKENKLYRNTGTNAIPVWVEVPRVRNIQVNRGPTLNDVEFHGSGNTSQIPGYQAFNGSFEYVRKRGADTVYDGLIAARDAGDVEEFQFLDDGIAVTGAKGWRAPVLLGEGSTTANGGDAVVETFNFGLADAYDAGGDVIEVTAVTI